MVRDARHGDVRKNPVKQPEASSPSTRHIFVGPHNPLPESAQLLLGSVKIPLSRIDAHPTRVFHDIPEKSFHCTYPDCLQIQLRKDPTRPANLDRWVPCGIKPLPGVR